MGKIIAISTPVFFSLLLGVGGLVTDLTVAHGPLAGIFYTLLVLCGLWFPNVRVVFLLAAAGTALTIIGHVLYQPSMPAANDSAVEHSFIILELWIIAALIHLHQQAEEKQRISAQQLKLLTDSIPALVSLVNKEERYVFVNRKYEEFFNKPAEEFINVPIRDVAGEAAYEIAKPYIARVFAGEEVHYEFWWDSGHHQKRYLRTSKVPYRDKSGKVKGFFCLVQDLTENKLIEEILQENERKYLTLLDNLPGTVYRCKNDRQWTMEFLSDGCLQLTGYPPERFYGADALSFTDITDETFREHIWNEVQKAITERQPFELEYRIVTASGEPKWVWEQGVGVYSEQGNLLALEGYITDISARKTAEEKLDHIVKELTRSNTELERFAYITSHDLREPLHTIASFAQLLKKEQTAASDKSQIFLENIQKAAEHMRQLIESLLEFSRLQHRSKPFKEVECGELMEYVRINLQDALEEHDAQITYKNLPTLFADRTQILQIFQNLIGNALKYHREKPAIIHINAEKQGNEWLFSVKDNGIGIEEKYHEQIFGLLKRLHSRSQYPGTDIGLAICKKAVENHGGRIWVESKLGRGSTFFFTIPIQE